jgi:hypothetical protein
VFNITAWHDPPYRILFKSWDVQTKPRGVCEILSVFETFLIAIVLTFFIFLQYFFISVGNSNWKILG